MRNQLQLSQATETLNRGKSYIEVYKEILDLKEMCQSLDNSVLLEYVPVKLVACFEQFFRDEYMEILFNPKTRQRLKDVDFFKNAKFDYDLLGAFEDSTITLGEYLSLLIPCSKLEDINKALSQMLGIKFLQEIDKYDVGILSTIKELFRLRHIYCHEVPLKEEITSKQALHFIDDSNQFLEISDDIIRKTLYSDNPSGIKEIDIAECEYKKVDSELQDLISKLKEKQDKNPIFNSSLTFIDKWKEYRETRAQSESSILHGERVMPLYYFRSLERTTSALIKELKEDYKFELKR